jgi:isopentenyl diphosphate isomerase/L-lactate dehydrogenase-like FMN-dependent dehydrogenase
MPETQWLTIPEIVRAARAALPANIWDFSCGGAESETTLRRNRAGFDNYSAPRKLDRWRS